jgi:hypothetical protein
MKGEAVCRPSTHTWSKLDAAWLIIPPPRHLRTACPTHSRATFRSPSPLAHITRFSHRLSIAVLKRNNPKGKLVAHDRNYGVQTSTTYGSLQSTDSHIPCIHRWVFQALTSDIVSLLQVLPLSDKGPTRIMARSGKVPSFDRMQRDCADRCTPCAPEGGGI